MAGKILDVFYITLLAWWQEKDSIVESAADMSVIIQPCVRPRMEETLRHLHSSRGGCGQTPVMLGCDFRMNPPQRSGA